MPTKPKKEFATIWYLTYALAITLSLPLDNYLAAWSAVTSWLVWVPVGLFVLFEGIAVFNDTRGDTKTEFTHYRIKYPILRWLIGLWLALLVYFRLPGTIGTVVGCGLFLWLPLHFAIRGVEQKMWKGFSSIWKRD